VENYVEVCGDLFDQVLAPSINVFRETAAGSFTEDQYDKLMARFYLLAANYPMAFDLNGIAVGDMVQFILLPDVVPMTEAQLSELVAMQKEIFTEMVGIGVRLQLEYAELFAEQEKLFQELVKAEAEEEKAIIQKKFSESVQKISDLIREPMQKKFDQMKARLDTLLTSEQKAKLSQIRQDIPDYLVKFRYEERRPWQSNRSLATGRQLVGAGYGCPDELEKRQPRSPTHPRTTRRATVSGERVVGK